MNRLSRAEAVEPRRYPGVTKVCARTDIDRRIG